MPDNLPFGHGRRLRADRDARVLAALRLGGRADVIAAALGISDDLVRHIAHDARKNGHEDAVAARKPYRKSRCPDDVASDATESGTT